ncbi:MAG: ATP-binding protein [Bacilli bacterium]|nr:ATP-binding protein [Bacilli bacterium]
MKDIDIPISLAFLVISFAYSITLLFFFFGKRRVKTKQNRIFGLLLIANMVSIIFEVLCIYSIDICGGVNERTLFINRLFLVCLIVSMCLIALYVLNLVDLSDGLSEKTKGIIRNTIRYIVFGIGVAGTVAVFFLDINLYKEGAKMYSFGGAPNVVFGVSFLNLIWCTVYLFITSRISIANRKRNMPVLGFLLGFIGCAAIQKIFPYITLANSVLTFINLLIYYSIENPMFNELAMAKNVATEANSAKKDFLSSMSHEIRTPLNAIVGLSQVMDQTDDIEEIHKDTKEMFVASHTLLDIIDSILDANSISANEIEIENKDYNLRDELYNVIHIVEVMVLNKNVDLKINLSDQLPLILNGDVHKLKRILTNLLTNAVKYTDEGFVYFTVNSNIKGNMCYLDIEVKDTGRGMSEEQKEKLFEQFYRLDEDKDSDISGIGLGLSITKSFVDLMKGKMDVETVPDLGTIIKLEIPQKVVELNVNDDVETL